MSQFFFIDDDQNLRNSQIDNIKVLNFENSLKLIKLYNIQTIILQFQIYRSIKKNYY